MYKLAEPIADGVISSSNAICTSMGLRESQNSCGKKYSIGSLGVSLMMQLHCDISAKYLVEVFKYPRTVNHIPTDAEDGYGSSPMIGLYGLVEPYSIVRITTMLSRVVTEDSKKKLMSKC